MQHIYLAGVLGNTGPGSITVFCQPYNSGASGVEKKRDLNFGDFVLVVDNGLPINQGRHLGGLVAVAPPPPRKNKKRKKEKEKKEKREKKRKKERKKEGNYE